MIKEVGRTGDVKSLRVSMNVVPSCRERNHTVRGEEVRVTMWVWIRENKSEMMGGRSV